MDNTRLGEILDRALHEAGLHLADDLRDCLRGAGLAGTMQVAIQGRRAQVKIQSPDLYKRELGETGAPPRPVLGNAARAAMPGVLRRIKAVLEG